MNKRYSREQKEAAIHQLLVDHKPIEAVSATLGMATDSLYNELKRIGKLDEYRSVVPRSAKRRVCTAEEKKLATDAVILQHRGINDVAVEFGVGSRALGKWLAVVGYSVRQRQIEGKKQREIIRTRARMTRAFQGKERRDVDTKFTWVSVEHPEFEHWRLLAVEWIQGEPFGIETRLKALRIFFFKYLFQLKLPVQFEQFFAVKNTLPDFHTSVCTSSFAGIRYNNIVNKFLNFVLLRTLGQETAQTKMLIGSVYANPVKRKQSSRSMSLSESVYPPLPYGYIDQLRQMLVQGPDFRDWIWAQKALGVEVGDVGVSTASWFPVLESTIEKDDPDCVWRLRRTTIGDRLEMWSPVRWVALLTKLILPLRTYQVRVLDSGESDTYRYENGKWTKNHSARTQGTETDPVENGVFRRTRRPTDTSGDGVSFYINTNKTADLTKFDDQRGYILPWPESGELHQQIHYWLLKLRNWQEKYNPISALVSWRDISGVLIPKKSEIQVASYPDSCFLFRDPEVGQRKDWPITQARLNVAWSEILRAFEQRLEKRGERHQNGDPIRLVLSKGNKGERPRTLFPLHSLRVSLVTALALEGQVPFGILQKLVGHSRLIMTLYYTKPSATQYRDAIENAQRILETSKAASIQNFLLHAERTVLIEDSIANSRQSFTSVVPADKKARNPAGWALMHHGLCLVGGIVAEGQEKGAQGGCYNGGPNQGTPTTPKYLPVPGGPRNCVRCRWFVTRPEYLDALVAHFNNTAYRFDELRNECLDLENKINLRRREQYACEQSGGVFQGLEELRRAERMRETRLSEFSDLAENLAACFRLIERCKERLRAPGHQSTQIVGAGGPQELETAINEVDSELLQLSGVCDDAEFYPDLSPGKAVLRRSQILDRFLYRQGSRPFFMILSDEEQLLVGNRFLSELARKNKPGQALKSRLEIVSAIEHDLDFQKMFGIDVTAVVTEMGLMSEIKRIERNPPGIEHGRSE